MPLPKPNPGEDRNKFVGRCVSFAMKEGKMEQKQAVAACFSTWRRNLEENEEKEQELNSAVAEFMKEI